MPPPPAQSYIHHIYIPTIIQYLLKSICYGFRNKSDIRGVKDSEESNCPEEAQHLTKEFMV